MHVLTVVLQLQHSNSQKRITEISYNGEINCFPGLLINRLMLSYFWELGISSWGIMTFLINSWKPYNGVILICIFLYFYIQILYPLYLLLNPEAYNDYHAISSCSTIPLSLYKGMKPIWVLCILQTKI